MRASVLCLALLATCVGAFQLGPRVLLARRTQQQRLALNDAPKYEIVPLEKENIENAASVTGGIVGFFVLGPIGGVVVAALSNWLVKKDNEGGDALRGVGNAVVNAYNYLSKINAKFDISTKISSTVSDVVEQTAPEDVKSKFDDYGSKVSAIVTEYDLVTKGKALAKASADLSEVALEKLDDLNTKYDFVKTAGRVTSEALETAKKTLNKE